MLLSQYQQFIHLSRYSRFDYDLNRRETLSETIDRLEKFYTEHIQTKYAHANVTESEFARVFTAIRQFEVLPSMRALMAAGPAAKKSEVALYNCSYVAINHPRAFDEILFILMNGTGVGFSVERQEITQLPEVPSLHETNTTIVVEDSKTGWAAALKQLVSMLYAGSIPKWDDSKVRPAGSPLKTFGGRSSGPEPLRELYNFFVRIFKGAQGRKLHSLECHDLVCMIGNIVVVGGVRRSALISLSNLSDQRLRDAKAGQWWEQNPQRALANNSVAYTEKPDVGQFMEEWTSLYKSHSGERGIFNRQAAKKSMEKIGRETDHNHGLNPCITADSLILTDKGLMRVSSLIGKQFNAVLEGKIYPSTKDGFFFKGNKQVIEIELNNGAKLKCTPDHKIKTTKGMKKAVELTTEDEVCLNYGHSGFFEILDNARKVANATERAYYTETNTSKFKVHKKLETEAVYDCTIPGPALFGANGIIVSNCSEILLRSNEFCNLSSVVARKEDTPQTLEEKVKLATILGTWQSTFTDFKYLRKKWKDNCEEERLLGVSITGIMDTPLLNSVNQETRDLLEHLKSVARVTNKEWAKRLDIPISAAITCVKPEGTVSQMTGTASGIHARYAPYYIRRVRQDVKDPLTEFMKDQGFPWEQDILNASNVIFSFPIFSPEGAIVEGKRTPIETLEHWLMFKTHFTEHNPSTTVSVPENSWPEVGAWVYNHFDEITGLSFLPEDLGTYKQAPYERCTKEQAEELLAKLPKNVDWTNLRYYESVDSTTGQQQLACTAGGCDI